MITKYTYHIQIFVLSIIVFLAFIYPVNKKHRPFDVDDMIEGKYRKPYVYRTLVPTTIRIISNIIPESIHKNTEYFVRQNSKLNATFDNLEWQKEVALKFFISSVFMILSFIAFGYLIPNFVFLFTEIARTYLNKIFISGLSLVLLPGFFLYGSHIYDPPQLFLFALALYVLYKRKFSLFYPLFILVTINKETSLLLVGIFFFYFYRKIPEKKYVYLIITYVFTYLVVRLFIIYIFSENEGPFLEYHFSEHNLSIRYSLIALTMNSGFFILLVLLNFLGWKTKPEFIKISFWVIFIPTFVLTIFFGYLDELRIYYELYPILLTSSALTINQLRKTAER
ncbi:MAG: hypothetical protein JW917_09170 [Ignavibacteria bacterium]|nr:hypothetical protein [Ignavibacteria bacterium]